MKKLLLIAALGFLPTLQSCTAPLILAGAAGGIGYYFGSERRDTQTIREDEQAQQAMIELIKEAHINPEWVIVKVFNHKMLLVGRVPSEEMVTTLSELAQQVPYVEKVYNRVEVGEPLSRQRATQDGLLLAKIKAKLIATKGINSATIHVLVFDGTVYLMGLVNDEEAQKAIDAVTQVKGVKKVINAMDPF
ncbi:MAG TPA: BON domain-containing protein [Sulfurivirga caldicuralii]|nr:BON domain-containing protein [Sulfurivirga caldicuralii]